MLFVNKFLNDNKITFTSNTISHHKSFIGFQYYAVAGLTNLKLGAGNSMPLLTDLK